jgi:hypothetical protein
MIPYLRSSAEEAFEQQLERRALVMKSQDFASAVRTFNKRRALSQNPASRRPEVAAPKELSSRERGLQWAKSVIIRPRSPVGQVSVDSPSKKNMEILLNRIKQGLQRHDEDRELLSVLMY